MNFAVRPEFLALITAILWASGSYFEKQGLRLGNLSPSLGITIRTAVALAVLSLFTFPHWRAIGCAGTKSILYLVLGGGVLAGALGMLCYYSAISKGELSRVMTIAFTVTPIAGAIIAAFALNEALSAQKLVGIGLCVAGVVVLMWGR